MPYNKVPPWNLTPKQMRFAEEYVANGYKPVDAYLAAYDCSLECAKSQSYGMAKRDDVQAYIQHLQKDRIKAMNISADRVLEELSHMAFAEKGDKDYNAAIKIKAMDLLQKQMGLQKQNINANVNQDVNINVTVEDDSDDEQGTIQQEDKIPYREGEAK